MHFDSNDVKERENEDLTGVAWANVLGGVINKYFAIYIFATIQTRKRDNFNYSTLATPIP